MFKVIKKTLLAGLILGSIEPVQVNASSIGERIACAVGGVALVGLSGYLGDVTLMCIDSFDESIDDKIAIYFANNGKVDLDYYRGLTAGLVDVIEAGLFALGAFSAFKYSICLLYKSFQN